MLTQKQIKERANTIVRFVSDILFTGAATDSTTRLYLIHALRSAVRSEETATQVNYVEDCLKQLTHRHAWEHLCDSEKDMMDALYRWWR